MSPEVVAGSFAVAASDLWSFGVMLFMMVSGGLSPFWAGNDYKTEARVLGGLHSFSRSRSFSQCPEKAPTSKKHVLL